MTARAASRRLRFVKMAGAGNDFVLVDNRASVLVEPEKSALARRVCRRRLGVGSDGLILIEPASGRAADFVMRYFNADGSEGSLCGNGTRCAAVFAREIGAAAAMQRIGTPAGVFRAEILVSDAEGATVRVAMPPSGPIRRLRLGGLPGGDAEVFALTVGVPHAVEIVPDPERVDVERRGSAIRRHSAFPEGANANFVALDGRADRIRLRTFERGVEAETLACGTGAAAAAAVARRFFGWPPAVPVRVASGDLLRLDCTGDPPRMEGPASRIFEGVLSLPNRAFHP